MLPQCQWDVYTHARHATSKQPCDTRLILPGKRRDALALRLVQRIHLHGPVLDLGLLLRRLLPRERVLHPFVVVAVGIVLAGVG